MAGCDTPELFDASKEEFDPIAVLVPMRAVEPAFFVLEAWSNDCAVHKHFFKVSVPGMSSSRQLTPKTCRAVRQTFATMTRQASRNPRED